MRKKNIAIGIAVVACAIFAAMSGAFTSYFPQTLTKTIAEADQSANNEADKEDKNKLALFTLTEDQIKEGGIETLVARDGTLKISTCVPGKITVNPNNYAHVVSQINAIVYETKKNLGDAVAAGEILATLESRQMAEAKANYLAALRREALATTLLSREQDLRNKLISAEQDFFKAHADAEEAKIASSLARQQLQALGLLDEEIRSVPNESGTQLRLYAMRAPIAGTIIKKHMTTGEVLDANEESFEIADLNTVLVEMAIYPKDLATIKTGQKIEVSSEDTPKIAQARIIYLSPIIDEESHTAKAVAEIDNSGGNWRPGSFVCADITTNVVKAPVVIHKEGLQTIEGKDYVFVRNPEGFEQRAVKIGRSDGEYLEVISGLSKGESYAALNSFLFKAELTKVADDD